MGLFSKGVELSKLHAEIDNLFNHNITFKVKEQTKWYAEYDHGNSYDSYLLTLYGGSSQPEDDG